MSDPELSLAAERNILSAVMHGGAEAATEHLAPADFYAPRHAAMYDHLLELWAGGEPTDPPALLKRLADRGELTKSDTANYVHEIWALDGNPLQIGYYAAIVHDVGNQRALATAAAKLARAAEISDAGDRAEAVAQVLAEATAGTGTTKTRAAFRRTLVRRSQLAGLPPVEPLIQDVLSLRSTVILLGPSGAGKTFVSLAWAASIGTGTPWLGHEVHQAGVLYVVGEGAAGMNDRIHAYEQAWKAPVGDDDVIFSVRPDSLTSAATWRDMAQEAKDLHRRVIFLDTFSSLAPDADETKDAAVLTRRMADLSAAIDGTVVLVHHPGWGDATRARGGSQFEANVDEVLILHGDRTDPKIALEVKKRKDGVSGSKTWLRRRPAHGSVVVERLSEIEWLRDTAGEAARILAEVHGTDPVTKSQMKKTLVEKLKVSETAAQERLTKLTKAGALKVVSPGGKKGYGATFSLTVPDVDPDDLPDNPGTFG
jgi:hypothetical protein